MKFEAKIFTGGGNTAGFFVPDDVMEEINRGKRFPIAATINGFTFRSMVTTYEGKSAVGLSIENRQKTNVEVGDTVEIDLVYDDKPREVEVPEDMQKELEKDKEAKEKFKKLTYSHKKEYVRWIEDAKKEETRKSRLSKLNKKILNK